MLHLGHPPFIGLWAAFLSNFALSRLDVSKWVRVPTFLLVWVAVTYILAYPVREARLSFRNLKGPEPESFVWGSIIPWIGSKNATRSFMDWMQEYGMTGRYRALAGDWLIYTGDPGALRYIFDPKNAYDFPKAPRWAGTFHRLVGPGILSSEGQDHRKQRKVIMPAFSQTAIKDMIPIFFERTHVFAKSLDEMVVGRPEGIETSVFQPLEKLTVDILGKCAFSANMGALDGSNPKLQSTQQNYMKSRHIAPWLTEIEDHFELISKIPSQSAKNRAKIMVQLRALGDKMVAQKKAQILKEHASGVEKGTDVGQDMLSRLLKSNLAADLPEKERLSDQEVMSQITTFILAGSATTSITITTILYRLAHNQDVQNRLREEFEDIHEDEPSLDRLEQIPLLENVVRECLRLDPPLPVAWYCASKDSVVPLSLPTYGRDGKPIEALHLKAGDEIAFPVQAINRSKEIWGPTAEEWDPDRYDDDRPKPLLTMPGVYGNLLTFLGGPRGCLGYRFSLGEMRVILFVLLRRFRFEPTADDPELAWLTTLVQRPSVKGDPDLTLQLPLKIVPLDLDHHYE